MSPFRSESVETVSMLIGQSGNWYSYIFELFDIIYLHTAIDACAMCWLFVIYI
jgi:hypothetical protein